MQALSTPEIMAAFDPIDRPLVIEPPVAGVCWEDRDFLAWRHPGEPRLYLVASLPERLVGLVLRQAGPVRCGLCDLCYSIDRVDGTALVTVESWTRPRTKLGLHVCSNLECSDAVRGLKWVYRMGETIPVGRRVERLQNNLDRFVRTVAGLPVRPAAG
jgi:hypothetical protein